MAWFADLPTLSNFKGQITNFTKEMLSEGVVEEIDERAQQLNEANERCVQLQEILNSKDAEISLLRRQNCELQKAVVELNAKPKESNDFKQDDDSENFWDPPSVKNRNSKIQNNMRLLQEQLSQATVRIRELEVELKRSQKINNNTAIKDEIPDGHQKAEMLRAKQDMVNRIIQMEEKNRETEKSMKRVQLDEISLINDFRIVISKLETPEKLDLVRCALKALESENEKGIFSGEEKLDTSKKINKPNGRDAVPMKSNFETNTNLSDQNGEIKLLRQREAELYKKIEELQEENKNLFANIEELDQQHNESIEELLSLKDELERKHRHLQTAYEQLYVECNEAQAKSAELQKKLEIASATTVNIVDSTSQSLQTGNIERLEKDIQADLSSTINDHSIEQSTLNSLEKKIKTILKTSCIDTQADESIFEAVARHYVDSKWKKDVLERKVTELTRDWKEAVETKDALQMECDDMQAHIDSLAMEIQRLKSNLPSIPEASEERVASLETETETLREEVKRLQTEKKEIECRNSELIRNVRELEASLRNQENVDAEIRNTKQQLEIAKRQLEGVSRNVEDNESLMKDLSQRLHVSLEENNELRKKIDALESTEKRTQEELRISLEKYENLMDKNTKACKDLENVEEKFKASIDTSRRLKDSLAIVQEEKNELERDNDDLLRKNEQLEVELARWKDVELQNSDDKIMKSLREEIEKLCQEKNDLEYDLLNMRRELDTALGYAEMNQFEIMKLNQENESLTKQNTSLLDQLTSSQDESLGKIELLSTEMAVLEQEHAELKQEAAATKQELNKVEIKLRETEERYATAETKLREIEKERTIIKEECAYLHSTLEQLRAENLHLSSRVATATKEELAASEHFAGLLNSVTSKCEELQTQLNYSETERKALSAHLSDTGILEGTIKDLENKCQTLEKEIVFLKEEKERMKSDTNPELLLTITQKMEGIERENSSLEAQNIKLTGEITETRQRLQEITETHERNAQSSQKTIEDLSNRLKEKEDEIIRLQMNSADNIQQTVENSEAFLTLKRERDELVKLVQIKHNESVQYHAEIQRLTQLLTKQISQIENLVSERDTNLMIISEKDKEVSLLQGELQAMIQRLKEIEGSKTHETCGIIEHLEQAKELTILSEKCNALEAALVQEQASTRMLQNQLKETQGKEANANKELERLRSHLVEMESSYTEEALQAEEIRQELEAKLAQAEEKLKNTSTVYTSASIRANQQVETLQQQMNLIIQQRDSIQNKLSVAEDKVLAQTASLTNLQLVLEQFQRDKEKDIMLATEKIQNKLAESHKRQEELSHEVSDLKEQLLEAKECLQAASRLSELVDKKMERISELSQEVERLTQLTNTAEQRIEEAKQSGEGKVDKNLVKNLFLGYLASSASDKSSVLRVFATVLDFNEAERDKAGLNNANASSSWFTRLNGSGNTPTKDQEASLSAAFVRFLESESKPKPQLPALPISNTPLTRPGHSRQHSTSSTQSTLLLSNVSLPTFPDFVPARNTGSILKEVLKDS